MTEWTHATWNLLHCLPEKIKQEEFPHMKNDLIHYIKGICFRLPCPECAHHASMFMNNIKISNVNTPDDLKNIIFIFHNNVNKRTKKKIFEKSVLIQYKSLKFNEVINKFIDAFINSTRGNFQFMSESYNRKQFTNTFIVYMKQNIHRFNN